MINFIVVGICHLQLMLHLYVSLLLASSVQSKKVAGDGDYLTVQWAQLEKKGESTTPVLSDAENQTLIHLLLLF